MELAKQQEEQSPILSACACIVMVTALEQATFSKLALAEATADEAGYDLDAYTDVLEKQGFLEKRIKAVPGIFTNGRLQLDERSPCVQSLCELISLRIKLLHIREGVVTINKGDRRDRWAEETFTPNVFPPFNPWGLVMLQKALQFHEAVSIYMREVIEPEEIQAGEIVREISR